MCEKNKQEHKSDDLVVVGSSAGGIEALSIFVGSLPQEFPAPIVLAQHLDPTRPSDLDAILQRRTALPVVVVNHSTILQAGNIYVVPANRHVSIRDHRVELLDGRLKRPRPSVDTLLSTAAEAYGERLIAAILTGSGSDGTSGAIDVKNAGGTVIVQAPQTARYPSMPLALPPTIVDFEVSIEKIGPLLYDLLNGVNIPPTEEHTEDILRGILQYISHQAKIDFRPYKASTILRRIGRRMAVTHTRSMRDYLEYLQAHAQEVGEMVQAFLINVAQFFRDAEAFAYLHDEILPQLIARARERDHTLRIWTAGCATGEEPYSIAMLLADILGPELSEWSIKIFATDLDETAVNFARRGLYSENLLKDIPQEYRERFFEHADHGYRITKPLRQMVIFGQQNLNTSAPFPRLDLVICRNVLIYFTPELQDYILKQFAFSLYPGGYLFLGKAEAARPMQSYYELINKHWKVYRCIGNALPIVHRQLTLEISPHLSERHSMNSHQHRASDRSKTEQELSVPAFEMGQLRRLNELLLRFLPVGIVIIDHAYHIISANSTARKLLELRDTGGEQDFLHAVRGIPYHQIRTAIDTTFRERQLTNLPEVELNTTTGGSGRYLSLSIAPMQLEANSPDLAVISITEVTQQVQLRQKLEIVHNEQSQLMNELSAANKRLNDMNKELTDANEELQVANEELVLTHEELQATNEEFETTNEELQATNEELETTNDELRARTGELQELMAILENERGRLAEMVELAPFHILVLRGPSLIVEAYNPRYARLLEGKVMQGRPIGEVSDFFWKGGSEIVQRARDAYRLDQVQTTPRTLTYFPKSPDNPEEFREIYFTYTIVPAHNSSGKVDSVILYAVDETKQRLHEVEEERERLQLIFENFSMAAVALFDAHTAKLLMGSPRYFEIITQIHHAPADHLLGRQWTELTFITPPEEALAIWENARKTHEPYHIDEFPAKILPKGEELIWDYHLIPLLDSENSQEVRFMLMLAFEITNQVRARKELEKLDALKDDFLSITTHELRTPLTAMLGNAQILQRMLLRRNEAEQAEKAKQGQSSAQEAALLEKVISEIHQVNKLLTEMVDVTRLRGEVFTLHSQEKVDVVELARQVVENYQGITKHEIRINSEEEFIEGTYDAGRLEQVLNNLLNNAIKYSPESEPVLVTIERRSCSPGEVVVSVKDNGAGISAETQPHIFERFYRAPGAKKGKTDGLGLGLYISHEIIAKQGGRLWLESEPGHGSTFSFALPLDETPG